LPIGDSQGGGQSHLTLALSPKGGEGSGSGKLPELERRRIGETARRGESQGHLTPALSPKGGEGNGSGMLPEPERRRIGETARRGGNQRLLTSSPTEEEK
jgi:hypothetical protein